MAHTWASFHEKLFGNLTVLHVRSESEATISLLGVIYTVTLVLSVYAFLYWMFRTD